MSTRSAWRRAGWGAACVLTAACTHPQRPFSFTGPGPTPSTTQLVARSLEAEGLSPEIVDQGAGVIFTAWADTGYRFHDPPDDDHLAMDLETVVYRRYHVAVAGDPAIVRVELEASRCRPDVQVERRKVPAGCQPIEAVFPGLQHDLDALGTRLQRVVASHGQAARGAGEEPGRRG